MAKKYLLTILNNTAMNNSSSILTSSLKQKNGIISKFHINTSPEFNPIVAQPYNIDKVTLEQVDNLKINYIFTMGRSASTLLGVMLMMHEQVVFTSEEVFPIILRQKYQSIKSWTTKIIQQYCDDFVLMSEGQLYPLFAGKEVLKQLLLKFQNQLNYERVVRLSYLAFGMNKDLSKITHIVDKQLRYYLSRYYLQLFPNAKILLLVRDPRDNVYSKYNRAHRKGIFKNPCLYIYTWKEAFQTYFNVLQKSKTPFLIVNYEKLISESTDTLKNISNFLDLPYTSKFFDYPSITQEFFENIQDPKLKDHFFITHKSLTQPISPQKVNEWKHNIHQSEIAHLINATWTITQELAKQLNYQSHNEFKPIRLSCLKTQLKVKFNHISSFIYFHFVPYFIKRLIKVKKYPYRLQSPSTYDRFLRQNYL
jgi:hypothetical protein